MLQPDLFLGTSGGVASPQSSSSHGIFSPPTSSSLRTLSTQGSPCAASCRGCSTPSPPPSKLAADNVHNERTTRRWYLTVIVLLYIGLITSFCLNVSLLLQEPVVVHDNEPPPQIVATAAPDTTACLVQGGRCSQSEPIHTLLFQTRA